MKKVLKKAITSFKNRKYKVEVNRLDTTNDIDYNRSVKKVMNLLSYTRKSGVSYSAGAFETGYHSLKIDGYDFKGQRNPEMRFKDLPFSLEGMSVLDIGCNQGGMIHTFSDQIKHGIGVDYDSRMINAANKIKSHNGTNNLDFYVFNLETENLGYLYDFIPDTKVDAVFLLSVCMWVKNWREVIEFSAEVSDKLVFESNGSEEQQSEQIDYLRKIYKTVQLVHEKSEDDATQKMRQLYYCSTI